MKTLNRFFVFGILVLALVGWTPPVFASSFYSFTISNFIGDSGAGGVKGLVPAPAAGDAAAGKFLKADGTWAVAGGSSPLTTKGDIYVYSTTNDRLPVGTDTYLLSSDSTQATGLKWVAPGAGGITGSGTVGTVPKFTGVSAIGDSIITEAGGQISVTGNPVAFNLIAGAKLNQASTDSTVGYYYLALEAHIESASNNPPTVTAGCGTSPGILGDAANGSTFQATDNKFTIVVGTGGTATSCTVTFGKVWQAVATCVPNYEGAILGVRAVPTTTTIVIDKTIAFAAGSKIDVLCF